MALIYNASFDSQTRILSLLDKAGNTISSCEVPSKSNVDDITKPLTLRATQDGSTVKLRKVGTASGSFQTSRDGGKTWVDYTIDTAITLNTGDKVSFRAKADRTSGQDNWDYFQFMMTGEIEAWHNVMSMYRTSDFATYESVVDYAFCRLFAGCSSLTKAPALPATTLADSCYWDMFLDCQSLAKAPELPATVLANDCYFGMFRGCRSLVKAPELPATRLASRCFNSMFYGCSNLNEVRCNMPSSYSSSDISSNYAKDWLGGVSSTGTFYTNADANWPSGISGIPKNWERVPERDPALDDITKPLTLRATQDGSTVKLRKVGTASGSFQTSRDGGKTWVDYTIDTAITLNTGDKVSFRAKYETPSSLLPFEMTGKIEAWHNVMSMIRPKDFATYNTAENDAFIHLFDGCTSLTKAPVLPATDLGYSSYSYMFSGCTSLTKAPELPATSLYQYCYDHMFSGCTSLKEAPVLPATNLEFCDYCYSHMFSGCTSLIKAPELPATKLAQYCYDHMFSGCTSLTKTPVLPATNLQFEHYCYQYMFYGCTSLTKAPELPATKLGSGSYQYMFYGCTSLAEAPALPATTLVQYCYDHMFSNCSALKEVRISATTTATRALNNWLLGVSATGDFYCDPNSTIFPTSSTSGIPANWTRHALADYPNP